MVILELAVTGTPPLLHWTVTPVPELHVQLKDAFLFSTAEGASRVTPVTASTKKIHKKRKNFTLELKTQKMFLKQPLLAKMEPESVRESTLQKLE